MDIKIKQLKVEDAHVLSSLLEWSRPSEQVSLERCKDLLLEPHNIFIGALKKDTPIGLIVAYLISRFHNNEMFLYEIDVHAEHRKMGIATQMIQFLKAQCQTRAIKEIFVFTNVANTAAMKLYINTGGTRPNSDDVMFSYQLV